MPNIPYEYHLSRADDSRLRRLAKRSGHMVRKSRWRLDTFDNHGGYMLVDADRNRLVAGDRFDLTGGEVVEWLIAQ